MAHVFLKAPENGTACIERYIPRDPLAHQGIYIDIFPCDALSDAPAKRKRQFWASKMVIARGLDRRGYRTDSLQKKLAMQVSRCLPTKALWAYAVNREDTDSQMVHSFFGASSRYEKASIPAVGSRKRYSFPSRTGNFPYPPTTMRCSPRCTATT